MNFYFFIFITMNPFWVLNNRGMHMKDNFAGELF